jgi:hypothetical protein
MRSHSDKTAETAIGSVDKEWRMMANIALLIREGHCHPAWADEQSAKFTGVYKRLLTDPLDYVRKEARR